MAVVKGNVIDEGLVDTASSRAVILLPPVVVVSPVKTVTNVVVTAATMDRVVCSVDVDRVVVWTAVVDDCVVVGENVLEPNVEETIARMVVVVILIGASVAMKGNFGQGLIIGGPSIESNTYPIKEPAVSPMLYDNVIIFPVASFNVAGTFAGAN